MSGRRRKALSPSLFPFLAVLVCTLGTLILLLALVSQNTATVTKQQAEAKQAQEQQQPRLSGESVQSMIAEEVFRVEQLVSFRDQQTEDLGQRRDQLTQIESHMVEIRERLKRLNDEVELATGDDTVVEIDEAELIALREKLLQEQKSIDQLLADSGNASPRVAIVPHKGPNGTDRRPIYLECTAKGMTIWPEGSTLTTMQLDESVSDANPLDEALRVIRHHVMQNYGDTTPPYPMLVVRPDGIETYASARLALRDWDDQFGYELVPAEVRLAYDEPDQKLKRRVDEAIRAAVIRQHGLNALAKRAVGKSGGYRRSGNQKYPRLSAASMDRDGRASGYGDHREAFSRQSMQSMQQRSTMNYGDHTGSGTGADVARQLDEHLRQAEQQHRSGEFQGNPFTTDSSGGGFADSGKLADRLPGQAEQQSDSSTGLQDSQARTNQFLDPLVPQDATPRHDHNPYTAPNMQLNSPTDAASIDAASSGGESTAQNQGASTAPTANASQGSGSASQPPTRGAMTPGRAPSSSQASSAHSERQPPANFSATREIVRREGADWALPRNVAHSQGNSIVRTIRVQCYPDRLVLLAPSRGGATEMFGLSDTQMNRATLELASAVRDRIDRWGAAIPGGRWQPRMEVHVMPGGEERFYQLEKLMSGSGVDVQGSAVK